MAYSNELRKLEDLWSVYSPFNMPEPFRAAVLASFDAIFADAYDSGHTDGFGSGWDDGQYQWQQYNGCECGG